jgi:hypothetical protein
MLILDLLFGISPCLSQLESSVLPIMLLVISFFLVAYPRGFTGVCGLGGSGIWRMAHVGPEWSHGMAYDDTRHTDMAKREGSWIGVDRRGRRSSKGVDCDILAPGMGYPGPRLNRINSVIYQQGASSFSEAYLERTSKLSVLGLEQFGMGDRPGSFFGCA